MKNIFRFLMAAAVMFGAVACSQSDEIQEVVGGEEVVSVLSLELEDLGTRLAGDAGKIDKVAWGIYDEAGNFLAPHSSEVKGVADFKGGKAEIEVRLFTGKVYDLVFFAYCSANEAYSINWKKRELYVDYEDLANLEARDAFFHIENDFVAGPSKTFTLKRPFAQLNAGQSLEDYNNMQLTQNCIIKSQLTTEAYTTMDLKTGVVKGDKVPVVLELNDVIDTDNNGNDHLIVGGTEYKHLAMNYLLVNEKELVDVKLNLLGNEGTNFEREYFNVPLQRNYRTNILGSLISAPSVFTIVIDAKFDGDHDVNIWDGKSVSEPSINENGEYVIASASELAWLAAAVNGTLESGAPANNFSGKTFVLAQDIDLGGKEWTPIGNASKTFKGTFNGNGKTVSSFIITKQERYAGLFGNVGQNAVVSINNLTVKGVKIVSHRYAAGIVAWGYAKMDNCHVEDIDITLTTKNGDWGDKAGGIVGYNSDAKVYVKNSTANNVTLRGYRDLGGIAGMANNQNTISGCSVDNITILQDLSDNYESATPSTLDAIVGRQGKNVILENNTVGENIYIATIVKSGAELQGAVERTNANIAIVFGADIQGNVTIAQTEGINISIDGKDYKYNGSIVVNGQSSTSTNKALYIKNVKFDTTESKLDFISSTTDALRYARNITLENCSFNGAGNESDVVAIRLRQAYNITVKNCQATNLHSLAQITSSNDLLFEGVEINAGRGVNLLTAAHNSVVFDDCQITATKADGYGIRVDAAAEKAMTVNNSTISAFEPVVLRSAIASFVLYVNDSVFNNAPAASTAITVAGEQPIIIINGVSNISEAAALNAVLAANLENVTINLEENVNYGTTTVGELKNVTINGATDAVMTFVTDADSKIENVTLNNVNFVYDGSNVNSGIVINANAKIENLVVDGCSFVGTGAKAGRGIYGQNTTANIELKNCNFKQLGYPIYTMSAGGYKSLVIEGCTFEEIKSWAIMPQYNDYAGDLTVTGCQFVNCVGGLVKAGKFTAGHTFTFTDNTITNSAEHPAKNWFTIDTTAANKVVSGNTKDGVAWAPADAEGLK